MQRVCAPHPYSSANSCCSTLTPFPLQLRQRTVPVTSPELSWLHQEQHPIDALGPRHQTPSGKVVPRELSNFLARAVPTSPDKRSASAPATRHTPLAHETLRRRYILGTTQCPMSRLPASVTCTTDPEGHCGAPVAQRWPILRPLQGSFQCSLRSRRDTWVHRITEGDCNVREI